jgi:transposase
MIFVPLERKKSHQWYLWVFRSETTVVFYVKPTRGSIVPEEHFGDIGWGIMSTGRFSPYKKLIATGLFLVAFYWAHAKRDFLAFNADKDFDEWSNQWIERIENIYYLNNERITHEIGSEEFLEWDKKLHEAMDDLKSCLHQELILFKDEKRSERFKVLKSLKNHWNGLILFIDYPWIPMDNNPGESNLRGCVSGRKAYCGCGVIWSAIFLRQIVSILQAMQWDINKKKWVNLYLNACAIAGGKEPEDIS